jgi:hypothetical protein
LGGSKTVLLRLEGLLHISREGRDFLRRVCKKITVVKPAKFMQFDVGKLNK